MTKSVGRKGDVAHVKLALRGAGGAVRGRVLDAAGAPIVGAVVELGEPSTSAGGWMMTAPPVHTSSGAGGAFVVEGLPPGSVRLLAGAPGYAVRTMRTDVVAGVPTSIEVVLTSGATIRGRTTHPSGAPVPALIYVHDLNADPLLVSIERSDANGAFVVEHVAPGSVPLIAQDASGSLSINDTVRVEEGQTLEWNPVLPEGAVIRGQLRDERDAPLAGWKVCAMSFDPPDAIGRASTGADGRFVLNGLASHAYALTFAGDAALPMETWWIIEHVQPGDDVVVRFPDRARPSAILKGTLLDANLDPPGTVAASIHMERDKFPVGTFAVDADTGEFTIGPLSPATYRVHAWLRNHKSKDFTVTLDVDQVLDLGEIELER
ncbi:MAG: carboxypeptidase-like regulatory domain-containing protein [Planctomycetota bacterium]